MPHSPQRMCVICRGRFAKASLTRYVAGAQGLTLDSEKLLPGRGYYVCAAAGCREKMRLFSPRVSRRGAPRVKAARGTEVSGGKEHE